MCANAERGHKRRYLLVRYRLDPANSLSNKSHLSKRHLLTTFPSSCMLIVENILSFSDNSRNVYVEESGEFDATSEDEQLRLERQTTATQIRPTRHRQFCRANFSNLCSWLAEFW